MWLILSKETENYQSIIVIGDEVLCFMQLLIKLFNVYLNNNWQSIAESKAFTFIKKYRAHFH